MKRDREGSIIPEGFVEGFVSTMKDVAEIAFFALVGFGTIGLVLGSAVAVYFLVKEITRD